MEKNKRLIIIVIAGIVITIILGIISDWKYYGLTDVFTIKEEEKKMFKEIQPQIREPKKPNLIIENVFITPKEPKVSDIIGIVAKIKNIGEQDIDEFKIKFRDQDSWGATKTTFIKGDLYRYVKVELKALDVHIGEHNLKVEIDTKKQVDEENEEDNVFETAF